MKTKKILTYALVILLSLTLVVGCSAGANNQPAAPKAGETIKIGGNFELTGSVAEFGKRGEQGARLAVKEINAAGGVLGKQIEFIVADNKSEAGESTAATTKLVNQDKVVGIVGPMTSGNTLAAIDILKDNKVPLVTPTGTNTKVTISEKGELNPWMFRACFIDPFQGEVVANYVLNTLKLKTAAMVVDQKGDYAKGLAESFKKTIEAAGGQVVATEQYVADQDKDFRTILTNIKAKNPEAIFVPGYYGEVGLIVKQARELGITAPILGGDGWGTGDIVGVAGKEAMNNTFFSDHVAADDPALTTFMAAYKKEFNQEPDSFAVLGYDSMKMMVNAIQKAGSTDTEAIRKALETTSGFKAVSGEINVDPLTHNPKKSASMLKFVDGKKVFEARVDPK